VQEIDELDQGYAFRFGPDEYPLVVDFVRNERLCCPFFHFEVEVQADHGPVWLRITGTEGVKAFILAELQPNVASADVFKP